MTRVFDDKARADLKKHLPFINLEYNGKPVASMRIKKISVAEARPFIATYHYSRTMPDSTKEVYAGYYGRVLAGIIVFGMGCNKAQFTSLVPDIKDGEYRELTRLWSPDGMPRNTESKLIMTAIKLLPTDVRLIVSFADSSHQHVGCVYQATNFLYCGRTNGGKLLVDKDGFEFHPRLLGMYRKRHPEYKGIDKIELCKILGYTEKIGGIKYRYVMLRNKKDKKQFLKVHKSMIQLYPKLDAEGGLSPCFKK